MNRTKSTALFLATTTALATFSSAQAVEKFPTTRPTTQASFLPSPIHSHDLTDLSLEDLMNVEVTSVSKHKETIADAPAAITVIGQEDIARSGFDRIPDLLRLVPGMDVGHINASTWAISTRGLNDRFADKLLVIQDGRSLFSPVNGGVYWNTVDYILADLDRIEVIRGPGATLWGSNAVNGVVNITSKDSRDTQGWLLSSRYSTDDSNIESRFGGKISEDTTYRVYFKSRYQNGFYDPATDGPASDSNYSNRAGFRVDKHTSDTDTFTVQGDVQNDQLRVPSPIPIAAPPFTKSVLYNGTDTTGNVLTRWNHRVNDDSDFSLQFYYDYQQIGEGIDRDKQHTADIDFNDRFMIGKRNAVSWGLGYRFINTDYLPTPIGRMIPSTRNNSLVSAYVQDTFAIVPEHFFATVGSKFEHNDFSGFEIEPSARLLWTPDEHNSVWGSISRASTTPRRSDEDLRFVAAKFMVPDGAGGFLPAEATVNGNQNFSSEQLTAYEVGYRVQATKKLSIDVATFYNNYDRLRSTDVLPTEFGPTVVIPSQFRNFTHGDTYGAEVAANLQVTAQWRLAASYSFLHSTFETEPKSTDTGSVMLYTDQSPDHQAQIHSYWDITKRVHLNASAFYVAKIASAAGYISTDFNVMWEPVDDLSLKIGILNAFDDHHPEFGTTGNIGMSSETPRTFYAQASYRF